MAGLMLRHFKPKASLCKCRYPTMNPQVSDPRRNRLAIKIPTTSAGMRAARALKKEGIESLATTLFSVPQAIAASQAGTYAISPYFNRNSALSKGLAWCKS